MHIEQGRDEIEYLRSFSDRLCQVENKVKILFSYPGYLAEEILSDASALSIDANIFQRRLYEVNLVNDVKLVRQGVRCRFIVYNQALFVHHASP